MKTLTMIYALCLAMLVTLQTQAQEGAFYGDAYGTSRAAVVAEAEAQCVYQMNALQEQLGPEYLVIQVKIESWPSMSWNPPFQPWYCLSKLYYKVVEAGPGPGPGGPGKDVLTGNNGSDMIACGLPWVQNAYFPDTHPLLSPVQQMWIYDAQIRAHHAPLDVDGPNWWYDQYGGIFAQWVMEDSPPNIGNHGLQGDGEDILDSGGTIPNGTGPGWGDYPLQFPRTYDMYWDGT